MKIRLLLLFVFFTSLNFSAFAQEKSKKELKAEREQQQKKEIQTLIDNRKFVFEAQKVTPQGGRLIILDYVTYFLKFNPELTTCDLPFFGRAYNIGYGGSDSGIKFEGKPENITVQNRKNSYLIRTTVKGNSDVFDLMLTVFYNGTATLSVNSNDRAPISYDGVVYAPKEESNK